MFQNELRNLKCVFWISLQLFSKTFFILKRIERDMMTYIQGEHKFFPWLQTNVYLYMMELYVAPQLEEFQPWIIFQQDGAPPHLVCSSVFGWNISKQVVWKRWSDTLATTIAGYHSPWLLFTEVCLGQIVFDTSSRYYKFEEKNNRLFCYNNWRHVGEHVERNWLSIRRSACNKRSTCWSVLMCCKKTSRVTLKKYIYIFVFHVQ